ncbi:hypothetical protein IMG5_176490 [Ichthyophthirius multifiliis]|uniref:Transmembrane protein n=1 Tax=Ichthyophthirius multifiliis TaxID=5932 RepID=G0R2B7_ICHMU|nr:hypothetical protein IMG5_176490 [Ichthyophthirius multifiliis]EGR28393.1 hypothetical protein IMG5_176490 [Ichthyophthirius multifiliis]|eukprot:XP_004027738.1 hypothetical protein IMG5_176490 [Ichthyophthirius multifiliis]
MTYGKIIFNNIKEYTPSWIKTIPYSQTVKPTFTRLPQRVGIMNADPKVKRMWRFLQQNVQYYPWLWQMFLLGISFTWFHIVYDPWLQLYKANNANRTYDYAFKKEKAYQKKKQAEEEGEQ